VPGEPRKKLRRKKKPPSKVVQYLTYLGVRGFATVLHCLPLELCMGLAAGAGDLLYLVDRRHRKRSMENLRLCFPNQPEAVYRRLTRDSFRLLAFLAVEFLVTPRYVRLNRLARHFVLGDKLGEALRLLVEQERGAVLLGGHYGNWEVLGYVLAEMGFETSTVARPLDNPYLYDFVLGVREAKGHRIIDKTGAMSILPSVLEDKGAVGFTADQDAGPKGMFVDFFGRPASTYKSIGLLALRYDVPVVIGFGRRLGYDFRFKVDCQDVIRPTDWKQQKDPLRYVTQRYTRAIENNVRGEPGQYLWLHRRWKTRPPTETKANATATVAA
jgi:KDO2-lipid IV(A) lauroyltransferase